MTRPALICEIAVFVIGITATAFAQDPEVSWRRQEETADNSVAHFHSPHAINLETTQTLSRQNVEFQVYHRFYPAINSGYDDLFGLDGDAEIRLGLMYDITDRLSVTLARTTVLDNLELVGKYRLFESEMGSNAVSVGLIAAGAWNSSVPGREDTDDRNFQYYTQGILNVLLGERIGLGLVPSLLYNSAPVEDPYRETFTLGAYAQVYVSRRFSVLAEWTGVLDGYERRHDNWGLGFEIQTAGHFFKIIATNSLMINAAHYLPGSDAPFDDFDNWHAGFNITRLLKI